PKKGILKGLYCADIKHQGTQFRIAYTIHDDHNAVVLILAGTRENFYDELTRRVQKNPKRLEIPDSEVNKRFQEMMVEEFGIQASKKPMYYTKKRGAQPAPPNQKDSPLKGAKWFERTGQERTK